MIPHTARRLKTAFMIMMVCVPVALTYEFIDTGVVSGIGVAIGIVLALPLMWLEESGFDQRMRRLPFSAAVLLKALVYVGALAAVFMSMGLVIGGLRGLTMQDYWEAILSPYFLVQLTAGFIMYVVIVFFRQLDRLLGPGVLFRYIRGRYHRSRRETRIFMFLDLKSSTALAERLGPEAYYGLVNEFCRDISGPVLDSSGEIYEYVGDEVVLTWREETGIKDGNCIRVFFDIAAAVEQKAQAYLDRFGAVPEFKAGVHLGEVMAAEIRDLKKGLVFNGDVLNTGARIEGECNRLGKRFLASADLAERLGTPSAWPVEDVGLVSLRGKDEPLRIMAFA